MSNASSIHQKTTTYIILMCNFSSASSTTNSNHRLMAYFSFFIFHVTLLDPATQTSSANDATEENGTDQQPMDTNNIEAEEDSVSERVGSVDSKNSDMENGSVNDSSMPAAGENSSKNDTLDISNKKPQAGKISVKAKIGDRSTSSTETMPTLESLEPETNG